MSTLINLVEPSIPKLSDIIPGLNPGNGDNGNGGDNSGNNGSNGNSNSGSNGSNSGSGSSDKNNTVTESPSVPKTGGKATALVSLLLLSAC